MSDSRTGALVRPARGAGGLDSWAPARPASCCDRRNPSLPVGPAPVSVLLSPRAELDCTESRSVFGFLSISLPRGVAGGSFGGHSGLGGGLTIIDTLGLQAQGRTPCSLPGDSGAWGCLVLGSRRRALLGASVGETLSLVAPLWGRSGHVGRGRQREPCGGVRAVGTCPTPFLGSQGLMVAASDGLKGHLVQWHRFIAGKTEAQRTGRHSRSHGELVAERELEARTGCRVLPRAPSMLLSVCSSASAPPCSPPSRQPPPIPTVPSHPDSPLPSP